MKKYQESELFGRVKQGLTELGYTGCLLQENYSFADILSPDFSVSRIPLAAFAQDPPSYRNACFGVVIANGVRGSALIETCRSLGAPQIFEVHQDHITLWKMTEEGEPEPLDKVMDESISALFQRNRHDWSPRRILKEKSAGRGVVSQLDFFDLGLLPLLEQQAREKLDRLLQETVELSIEEYQRHAEFTEDDYPPLFRLLFRLIAAKILADREHPGNWLTEEAQPTIEAVQEFYFRETTPEEVLGHSETQQVAWERVKNAFHFQNLSVDSLAYVYENTLVAPDTRRLFGIHSTPPAIAEYITSKLPFEEMPFDQVRIFEPFAGHAVFLVAAMQRMRDLLPQSMSSKERHQYFVKMLCGIEIDDFAREVARLSLMLADYPNPDGWRLYGGDALKTDLFDQELDAARIVLCNPPFEDFDVRERAEYVHLPSVRKPATVLHKVLQNPPEMLGFVLPRSFLKGRSYKSVRSEIGQTYSSLELLALPDKVFRHSDAEAVLLLASKRKGQMGTLRTGQVDRDDLAHFYLTHEPTRRSEVDFKLSEDTFRNSIWLPSLPIVWKATSRMRRLRDVAEIHRGIEYNVPFRANEPNLVSEKPRSGFRPGIRKVQGTVEPFLIRNTAYLNVSQDLMRGMAYKYPWSRRKLVVNSARRTRGRWPIAASIDYLGVVCYQNFHGIWPDDSISLETLAAVLNGPVANAFLDAREGGRHLQIQTLLDVPIPDLQDAQEKLISSLVHNYTEVRKQWLAGILADEEARDTCDYLLRKIDAETLRAYDLSPRTERSLLDYFVEQRRPGPVEFKGYFPKGFNPFIPLHRYLSEEMERASATATLSRLPVVNDALISEAMASL